MIEDAIIFLGSDNRLESEVETGRNDGLKFAAPASGGRVALYGPYVTLSPGHFRIELAFEIYARGPGDVKIELCHNQSRTRVYARSCFPWELDAGLIRISYSFSKGVENLEVRLIVPAGFSGKIKQLSIAKSD